LLFHLERPPAHKQGCLVSGHEAVADVLLDGNSGFLIFMAPTGAVPTKRMVGGVIDSFIVMLLLMQAVLTSFMRKDASRFFCLWQARLLPDDPAASLGET